VKERSFKAIISSDWNQCLAPCGPFDPIIYSYPDLTSDLTTIFKAYTGNKISLGTANKRIQQMDQYLKDTFVTYKGVPELIDWCAKNKILFMINTTGLMGYFQRIFAKNLLQNVPVISANPMIQYPSLETDLPQMYGLDEIQDKGKNTAYALKYFDISEKKIVIIGDSGGDGPHFEWGKKHKAYLIGSMAKQSLMNYCKKKKVEIDLFWGPKYTDGEERSDENERLVDFMALTGVFEKLLG
jgi:2-hydroxy-3-keto-5-methylthiopentenyl-1-phosphate phosphatase